MSEQLKISSFYRASKNGDALPAKKRRSESQPQQSSDEEVPAQDAVVITAPKQETIIKKRSAKVVAKPSKTKTPNFNSKNVASSKSYTILKSFGKQLACKKLAEDNAITLPASITTIVEEEATSFSDNHGYTPPPIPSTPTHSATNACNTRKRKLTGIEELIVDETSPPSPAKQPHTIEKATAQEKYEPIDHVKPKTPSSVRKKLLLPVTENETSDELDQAKLTPEEDAVPLQDEKPQLVDDIDKFPKPTVSFQYKGILSPRKALYLAQDVPKPMSPLPITPESHVTPKKETPEITARMAKSPAVKSLASLLSPTKGSPKKLTPEQVKAQLGKCGKLADLKARLSAINNGAAKLKEFQDKNKGSPQLKKFSSIHMDVAIPVSPQKTASPQKASEGLPKTPAFERFHALAQPASPSLHLPFKFKYLAEVFRSVDTVVGLLYNRREIVTFQKLKLAVQEMMRRNFTEVQLGQICRVFPTAYRLAQEKRRVAYGSLKKEEFDLTITPNLNYLTPVLIEEDNILAETITSESWTEVNSHRAFGPSALLERKNVFHNRLLRILKQHHKEFLSTLEMPLAIPDDKLTRWHPAFNVDDVLDIKPLPLPKPPNVEICSKAKDVLEKARTLFSHVPTIDTALQTLANSNEIVSHDNSNEPTPKPTVYHALKGISSSLLEKIRAREASRLAAVMTRKPEEEQERKTQLRLPDLTRLLRNIFVTEKRNTMTMELVVARLTDSWTASLTATEIEAHVRLLAKQLPEWLSLPIVSGVQYVKFNKTLDINHLVEKLLEARKTCA